MKKWNSFFLLLLVLLTGVCQRQTAAEQNGENVPYYIYYLNKDAVQLEKEEYKSAAADLNTIVTDLIARIGSKKSEERQINLLPQEVTINSYELQNGTLLIDFNSQYSKMSRTREILVRAGIVKNFIQFPGISSVKFTITGEELTDSKRQPVGEMDDRTFLDYSGIQEKNNYRYDTLTLYYTNAEGTGLVKEIREVYYRPNIQKEREVLEYLAKGPREKGNYPTLANNVDVLNIYNSDNICYVNLTQSFVDSQLDLDSQITIYSIVNSLAESCGVSKVELSVEGKHEVTLRDDVSLYQFFEKNEELILAQKASEATSE